MAQQVVRAEDTEYAQGWDKRENVEALDEVVRECQVRARCFPRWVEEGRMSRSDARDRLQRLIKAKELLELCLAVSTPEPPARPF